VQTQIHCPQCHYNLTGIAIGSACPECGLVIDRGAFVVASHLPMSGKAIASLVLGIVSIVGCMFYGIISVPCGVTAIVLARSVQGQIMRQEVSPGSAGTAQAGLVCGIIGTILGGAMLLFLIIMIFSMGL
jgi:hypothetical protein